MYKRKALFLKIIIFPDYQMLENILDTFKSFFIISIYHSNF